MDKKTNERVVKRGHKIPTDYIESISDRIHQTTPTKEILGNTLTGVWSLAYTRGYMRNLMDRKWFKGKREVDFQEAWKSIQDEMEDQMHPNNSKNQNKK